jgi:hypothetical protein
MSPKARFQMFIEPDQLEALRALQERTGAPIGEHIRRAIAEYLKGKTDRKRALTRKRP